MTNRKYIGEGKLHSFTPNYHDGGTTLSVAIGEEHWEIKLPKSESRGWVSGAKMRITVEQEP